MILHTVAMLVYQRLSESHLSSRSISMVFLGRPTQCLSQCWSQIRTPPAHNPTIFKHSYLNSSYVVDPVPSTYDLGMVLIPPVCIDGKILGMVHELLTLYHSIGKFYLHLRLLQSPFIHCFYSCWLNPSYDGWFPGLPPTPQQPQTWAKWCYCKLT